MDCQMPEMDGFEATRQIRKLTGAQPRHPCRRHDRQRPQGDRERALAAGMDDYLAKPVTQEGLTAVIEAMALPAPARPGAPGAVTPGRIPSRTVR